MSSANIEALCADWLSQDKNPETRKEIHDLQASGNHHELELRLSKRIGFGTAGLRAKMEAGFSRINDLTVLQASQGLCAYILAQEPNAKEMGIVIGHDHRHHSSRFARLAAAVFLRAGLRVYLLKGLSCTPLVPFGVGRLKAAGGIMVTASHNPAQDNGYKVYWSNGVQIIPPHDSGIAESILQNLDIPEEVWSPDDLLSASDLCIDRTEVLKEEYIQTLSKLCKDASTIASSAPQIVYTPMHGVGLPYARSILSAFNFPLSTHFHIVDAQAEPDPDFPTVKFPNPEEKGALDLAIKTADEKGVQIVVANDPDADRFCAAEKSGGTWNIFTGDQMGVMLGAYTLQQYKASGKPIDKLAMLASTVSSKMLAIIAEKEGFRFRETLTGFKWLGNAALELEKEEYETAFAYEEAIGFMVSPDIRDKDGISALAVFVSLAASLQSQGKSLTDYLNSLYDTYGQFSNHNSYWICRDPAKMARIFDSLRTSSSSSLNGPPYPQKLGEWKVSSIRDITAGYDSSESDGVLRVLPQDKSGQMLQFTLEIPTEQRENDGIQGLIGTIRASGTEPKCKGYLEGWGSDKNALEKALQNMWDAIAEEWLHAKEEGLESP